VTEPVAIQGAVIALFNSVVALLVLTGVFTADVGAAVLLIAGNAVTLAATIIARGRVTPTASLVPAPPAAPPAAPAA
jgi:hypothetical protein